MLNYLIIFFSVFVDQTSKYIISSYEFSEFPINIFSDFIRFTYITNSGIAFGLNPFGDYKIILFIVSIIAIVFVIKILNDSKEDSLIRQFSLSFIVGGAIGNLLDRFFTSFHLYNYSGVIDFIDIGISGYRFYIFNFADFFISLGIILYLISFINNKPVHEKQSR